MTHCSWGLQLGAAAICRMTGTTFSIHSHRSTSRASASAYLAVATAILIPTHSAAPLLKFTTGCTFIGAFEPTDYNVTDSDVCRDGKFVGLAIDEGDDDGKNQARIEAWCNLVK